VKGLADEIVGENLGGANGSEDGENQLELMHQPLSVALWISQALMPIGMPQWFGPLNRNEPTTLRVALHIQVSFVESRRAFNFTRSG
jgi:hypothetical protein